jgi:hypothetical protein
MKEGRLSNKLSISARSCGVKYLCNSCSSLNIAKLPNLFDSLRWLPFQELQFIHDDPQDRP